MDAALLALKAWPTAQLLLSGTSITDGYDEVIAMRRYALAKGFDSARIRMDRKGDNTVRTIGNLRSALPSGQKAVIISQTWHLPRALWLGEDIDLHGLACNPDTSRQGFALQGREHLARIENFWRVKLPF
jgi:SanA protein